MKKFSAIITLFLITSCAIANPPTGSGVIYTNVKELVYYDPYVKPNQRIMLCSKNILGLVAFGDSGLDDLKLQSSIRKIYSIERTYVSRFFVLAESCMTVVGE
ncbi:MAG TPA: TRL domain-containing protein [Rickettsiales bacterium]|nr:TRL domain-containing protein [Rickettsiales bacterium]